MWQIAHQNVSLGGTTNSVWGIPNPHSAMPGCPASSFIINCIMEYTFPKLTIQNKCFCMVLPLLSLPGLTEIHESMIIFASDIELTSLKKQCPASEFPHRELSLSAKALAIVILSRTSSARFRPYTDPPQVTHNPSGGLSYAHQTISPKGVTAVGPGGAGWVLHQTGKLAKRQ